MDKSANVTFELVTPAYSSGADLSRPEGLRPPTLKALLRFWWRTMHPEIGPGDLFEFESRLFGSTATGQGLRIVPIDVQQKSVDLSARKYDPKPPTRDKPNHTYPLYYMAFGADTYEHGPKDRRDRKPIPVGTIFRFRIVFRGKDSDWEEVKSAIWLLDAFGGFGSRSRRGFGGIQLVETSRDDSLNAWRESGLVPMGDSGTPAEIRKNISNTLPRIVRQNAISGADHTSFTAARRIFVGPNVTTASNGITKWATALKLSATVYHDLRRMLGTSFNHAEWGKPEGEDFNLVADYLKRPSSCSSSEPSTLGAVFGLPHNYKFSKGMEASLEVASDSDLKNAPVKCTGRRASQLFFKVAQIADCSLVPLVVWLPTLFLPQNYEVRLKANGTTVKLEFPCYDASDALFANPPVTFETESKRGSTNVSASSFATTSGWQEVKW